MQFAKSASVIFADADLGVVLTQQVHTPGICSLAIHRLEWRHLWDLAKCCFAGNPGTAALQMQAYSGELKTYPLTAKEVSADSFLKRSP